MSNANLLNLYECADRLQVPVKWLKEAAITGKIPCLQLGKHKLRFNLTATRAALLELAAKRTDMCWPSRDGEQKR